MYIINADISRYIICHALIANGVSRAFAFARTRATVNEWRLVPTILRESPRRLVKIARFENAEKRISAILCEQDILRIRENRSRIGEMKIRRI